MRDIGVMKIHQAKRNLSSLKLRTHYKLLESVLRGNRKAREMLTKSGCVWHIVRCNPESMELSSEPAETKGFYKRLQETGLEKARASIAFNTALHLSGNAEHIAPLPVLTSVTMISGDLIIHARDFGKGLGKYLDYIGYSYSTRPHHLQVKFGLDDQGNGLLLAFNQVLNGCLGRAVIESSGQKTLLWKSDKEILGQRILRSRLSGTRFTFFLPLGQKWTQESSGWDTYDLPRNLKIEFLSE